MTQLLDQAMKDGTTKHKKYKQAMAGYKFKVLKPVTNKKLFKKVLKGKFKDYRILTLTLEERATCPRSCHHWGTCYGNNMPFAHRLEHGDDLIYKIDSELYQQHGKKLLVRLHILGDFWSPEYVYAWHKWLSLYPDLAVWGYTHNWPDSPVKKERDIAHAISETRHVFKDRFNIRWSDRPDLPYSANSEDLQQPEKGKALICPEQLGGDGCGKCTLCWDQPDRQIIFKTH